MRNQQLIIQNQLVSYFQIEQAGHKCLLFLHGWRSNKEIWQGVVNQLISKSANQSYTFCALDLPGFGQSQVPSKAMTVGEYAEVVNEFIKKLDLKNVVIIGHSFGGRVGIKLAAMYPSAISKLVLADSAGFAMDPTKKSTMNLAAKIAKPFFKPKFMQGLRKSIYKKIGAEDYIATPELQKTFVNITGEDLSQDMGKITCSTLIINGENDADTPVGFGERMKSLIPNSTFVILKNAGHFSFLDQPEQFIKALSDFAQ